MKQQLFDGDTTNNYVWSIDLNTEYFEKTLIWIKNQHESNSVDFKVISTMNETDWEDLKIETTLTPSESWGGLVDNPWSIARVGVKSTVMDNHGTVECYANMKGWR